MIQLLSSRYRVLIGHSFLLIFHFGCVLPLYGRGEALVGRGHDPGVRVESRKAVASERRGVAGDAMKVKEGEVAEVKVLRAPGSLKSGGPSQPEMSTFKSVGTGNMVNLFTGDFSYNIPLLDVGGYPVNIFYDGGITMEQEASWVGLGWNINPGTVSRNMRGVPDDFNGEEKLKQTQMVKPNITWGASISGDLELAGVKAVNISGSFGVSINNHLGPALDLGVKGVAASKITNKVVGEKFASGPLLLSVGVNLNSRYGMTFSPGVSLTASVFSQDRSLSTGLSAGTSYNSRTGIKALHISEQMTFSGTAAKNTGTKKEGSMEREGNMEVVTSSISTSIGSSTISFTKPSYIPSLRLPITNEAYSGRYQTGGALFGVFVSPEIEVYRQSATIAAADRVQTKPLIGYLHYEKAKEDQNAVMDFTRFNDKEVTSRTPVISAPQYTYDVFSIQGEGTGGSIRAYRNDLGYVRDNYTRSQDRSVGIGLDIGNPGHYGANINRVKTPSSIGDWSVGNKLSHAIGFKPAGETGSEETFENVYFRNPGETSVINDQQFARIGGTDLVRFKLGGSGVSPTVEPVLERFSKSGVLVGNTNMTQVSDPLYRKKRTQVINFLTGLEASKIGLDKKLRSYDNVTLLNGDTLQYEEFDRVNDPVRKGHHISQINVTEADGKRYIYGVPVYNLVQKDFSFSVSGSGTVDNKVPVTENEASLGSSLLLSSSDKDGYLQITETPAYAHSFLLSGLLSTDYVDLTGNGISEDDFGTAVKFNYNRVKQGGAWAVHKWRSPLTSDANMANFIAGNKTEDKDDKGVISYGERESWYMHSIESKTMIAIFTLGTRNDGKATMNEFGGINPASESLKRLQKIDLYSKSDLKANGISGAKPIKTVHFVYSYSLCDGIPDNLTNVEGEDGKLTLTNIYFTFNGQNREKKNQYVFSYGDEAGNAGYQFNASDRWGNYKPASLNPGGSSNADYPYSLQDKSQKQTIDQHAAAWSLKKILLPSGGQMEVEYEADDYAYVQNKRAAVMMKVVGFANTLAAVNNQLYYNRLYDLKGNSVLDNDYVVIQVPEACSTRTQVFDKYLSGIKQLAFKLSVNMPNGVETVMSYATISNYDTVANEPGRIWIKLNRVDQLSPLSLTAIEYLREQLPGQAFKGYNVSETDGLAKVGDILLGMLEGLKGAFKNPVVYLRSKRMAQTVDISKSFVRLNDPDGIKYGGGQRVKSIKLKDNWQAMTGQYTSEYGQVYDYSITEVGKGTTRTVSSGVASYEPAIGGEENPFQTIEQVANTLPLGPTSYGSVEMPVLDAFFPAPLVGYSKVTVRAINKNTDTLQKSRSGIGKQVTEFYTARDYPVYYGHTSLGPTSEKTAHSQSFIPFLSKHAFDSRALSQGFIVETNDMHGKMKSEASYAENDEKAPVNYTKSFYRNTGARGLDEKFEFVHAAESGAVKEGVMGVDIELMVDAREFAVKSHSLEIQAQLDLFPVFLPIWLPFIWPVSTTVGNVYRAVTATKVISYHSILDSVVVFDKGSKVSTKNLAYDAETGSVIVNRTNNEFDKPVYTTSYPAYWAYSGMGLAYKNIDAIYRDVDFYDGKLLGTGVDQSVFESGDELFMIVQGDPPANCAAELASGNQDLIWVMDKQKTSSSLTNTAPDLIFIDAKGKPYTRDNVSFRIVRSGKRNMLGAQAGGATTMVSPVVQDGLNFKLAINNTSNTINASAVEYREKWQTDNDVIKRYTLVYNTATCVSEEVPDCNGYLSKSINPYRQGLIGNFRVHKNMVYYGARNETDPSVATELSKNGFIADFKLYWDFNVSGNLVPDVANLKWIWNSQVNKVNARGLELETKDALNIYTAAQYGFNKTLPVAIANNARYHEMAYDGFEDLGYNETLSSNQANNCSKPHTGFGKMTNATIINTDTTSFTAHSGKYVLGIPQGVVTNQVIVTPDNTETYNMNFGKDTTKSLVGNLGANYEYVVKIPSYVIRESLVDFASQNLEAEINISPSDTAATNGNKFSQYSAEWDYYVKVTDNTRVYSFEVQLSTFYNSQFSITNEQLNNIKVDINTLDGQTVSSYSLTLNVFTHPNGTVSGTYSTILCPGIYHIKGTISGKYNGSERNVTNADDYFSWRCTNFSSPIYKKLSTENGCIRTTPIPATETMLNTIFSVPANRKMVFSAWVKENCDPGNGLPCFPSAYTHNQVEIAFTGGAAANFTLKPTGNIIEGWQRYEDYFTAPVNSTTMTLGFRNTTNQMIYFDDIRIHPFNANMKSYVYDPVNLRLKAELDANNYASIYEYDEEGGLIRTKAETKEGIKTIQETRSARQKDITSVQ